MSARVAIRRFFALLTVFVVLSSPLRAQSEPPPLSAYGELPSIEDVAISSSGNKFAVLGEFNERRMLVVFNYDLKVERAYPLDGIKVRGFYFVNDDLLLLRRSTTQDLGFGFAQDKFEFYQAFLISIGNDKTELVFGNRRDLVDATFGFHGIRSVDGRPTLYAVDLLSNKANRVDRAASEDGYRDWLIGQQGQILARLDISQTTGKWQIRGTQGVIAEGKNEGRIGGRGSLVVTGRNAQGNAGGDYGFRPETQSARLSVPPRTCQAASDCSTYSG